MRYDEFVTEYLAAGLIVVITVLVAVADLFGFLQPWFAPGAIQSEKLLPLSSVPGALLFLALVLASYPIGYMLFDLGLKLSKVIGRKAVYESETGTLKFKPYCEVLTAIKRDAGTGFAAGDAYEDDFSLTRMFLYSHHGDLYSGLHTYWTRISRMFLVLTVAFFISFWPFAILSTRHLIGCNDVWHLYSSIAGATLALAFFSRMAYLRALRLEIRNYVGVAKALWAQESLYSFPLYMFAYGSNMHAEQMKRRVPSAREVCTGRLNGYVLKFNKIGADGSGKANIVAGKSEDAVYGVVYEVNEKKEIDALDAIEKNYDRIRLPVPVMPLDGGPGLLAEVYQARSWATEENMKPSETYLGIVVAGAKEHGLPPAYIETLAAVATANQPPFPGQGTA